MAALLPPADDGGADRGAGARVRAVRRCPELVLNAEELLFDQMRAVVLSDGRVGGGELVLNAEFLRVAAHWGFHPLKMWAKNILFGYR